MFYCSKSHISHETRNCSISHFDDVDGEDAGLWAFFLSLLFFPDQNAGHLLLAEALQSGSIQLMAIAAGFSWGGCQYKTVQVS